jgi:hypothetical protein
MIVWRALGTASRFVLFILNQLRTILMHFASQVLAYGQSDYVRQFGMFVEESVGPLKIQARVLKAPALKYGLNSKQPTIVH